MSEDAGSIYSSVRIRLDSLDQDLKGVYSRLDQLESKISEKVNKPTQQVTSSFNTMALAGVAAFTKLGQAAGSAIQVYAGFEQSMANVSSVAGATSEEFDMLNDAAKTAGETTRYTASQAADALYYLSSAGFSASQSVSALNGVLSLAQATGSDLASTSNSMAATISQFGLKAEDANKVANVFAAAITSSQANMDKLTSSLRQVGPVAGSFDISLEEVVANLDALYNKGFQGEQAGTALRSILLDLADSGSTVVAALEKQGLSYDKVNPDKVGLTQAFKNMSEAGVNLTTVFGKESASEAIALVSTASDLDNLQTKITGTNKAAEAMATQNDTLSNSFDIFKSKAQAAGISMGEVFSPALRVVIDALGDVIELVTKLPDGLKAAIASFSAVGIAMGALSSVAGVLGISLAAITPILGPIALALGAVGTIAVVVAKNISEYNKEMKETSDIAGVTVGQVKEIQSALQRGQYGSLDEIKEQIESISEEWGISKDAIIKAGLASDNLTDKYKTQLKTLQDLYTQQKESNDLLESFSSTQDLINEKLYIRKKLNNEAVKDTKDLADEAKEWQKALKDALGVSDVNSGAQAVTDYISNLKKQLASAVDAAKTTGSSVSDVYQDYASKVNTAITDLIQSGQYTGSEATIQRLLKFRNEIASGITPDTSGYDSEMLKLEELEIQYTKGEEAAKRFELANEGWSTEQIDAYIEKQKEVNDLNTEQQKTFNNLSDKIESLGSLSGDTFDKMKASLIDQISTANLTTDQMDQLLQKIDQIKESTIDWGTLSKDALSSSLSAVESFTESLAEGDDVWSSFASAGLDAIASVIEGLAQQLTVLAGSYLAQILAGNVALTGAFTAATAEAAIAYAAAGTVKGYAANMATGGIVEPSNNGTIVRVAENNNGEVMFNTGSSGQTFTNQMAAAIASQLNGSSSSNQEIVLKVDGREMTRVVARYQKNGDY